MPNTLKLTDQLAADIRARVKGFDGGAIEKLRKAKDDNGTFDVIISTEDTDRSGEIVKQSGWELTNYKNNPIVLWGHDYYSLPVGVCTETYLTEKNGVPALGARGVFLSADINPFAQQVRRLYEFGIGKGEGVGCTTSVGFIPKDFDENARNTITKAELLEFSFVPIPANQGVGPAHGRAFTFEEAKELGLDMAELRTKGLEFIDKAECKGAGVCEDGECDHNQKAAAAGDECTMDDGSPGTLSEDSSGALVCTPKEEKSAEKDHAPQKALLKALGEKHERHTGEVEKAFDEFREKVAVVEDQGDLEDAGKSKKDGKEFQMRESIKDLRGALRDEHAMHRAKAVACFREFDPSENKAFDKKEHLKSLRGEHESYETKCTKSMDDFEERCMKSVQGGADTTEDHTDWVSGVMDAHARAHKKAVGKIAKKMCREAFGEEDQADEKTVEILKEFLAPHVPSQLLGVVAGKIGSRITAANRERLREAHEHLKAASAVVEAFHGMLGNDDGEEGRSGDDHKSSAPAPRKQRSRPAEDVRDDELNTHLLTRDILRGITTAAQRGLEQIKQARK